MGTDGSMWLEQEPSDKFLWALCAYSLGGRMCIKGVTY